LCVGEEGEGLLHQYWCLIKK